MEYEVGKTYYLKSTFRNQTVTVDKVGKKYATLKEIRGKVDIITNQLYNNTYFIGRLYPSEQACDEAYLINLLLLQLRFKLSNISLDTLTLDQVKQAYAILGVDLGES